MVAIIAMRNNMLIMIAQGFTLFSRNTYFIKSHKYQAGVLLYMQISCKIEMLKSEYKEVMSFRLVALITEKDQRCESIEKYLGMWGKFYENIFTFLRQL